MNVIFDDNSPPTAEDLKALEKIDWASALQAMNKWYDRQTAALRLKDRVAREKEFDKIEQDLSLVRKAVGSTGEYMKLVTAKDGDKVVGKKVGDVLTSALTSAVRRVQQPHDRISQVERNLQVAFAMAAYRADNNRYPEQLADVSPQYLAVVHGDIFSGKALIY